MTEILVSPTEETVLYMSRRSNLRLTMRPRYPERDPVSGQLTGMTRGAVIAFRDGQVRVPKVGVWSTSDTEDCADSEPMDVAGVHEWLQRHRLFGNQLEGFWRVDPTAPPVSQDEMRALMQASIRLDDDMLREVIRQEKAGWGRQQIIEEAEVALESIAAIREREAEAVREAEAAAAKKPGPKPKAD